MSICIGEVEHKEGLDSGMREDTSGLWHGYVGMGQGQGYFDGVLDEVEKE